MLYLNLCYIAESIAQDHFDIALLLIDSHCDVCQTDRLQQAPIHSAVRKGRYLYMRPKIKLFLFPPTRPTVKKTADRKNYISKFEREFFWQSRFLLFFGTGF